MKNEMPGCPLAKVESVALVINTPLVYMLMTFPTTARKAHLVRDGQCRHAFLGEQHHHVLVRHSLCEAYS